MNTKTNNPLHWAIASMLGEARFDGMAVVGRAYLELHENGVLIGQTMAGERTVTGVIDPTLARMMSVEDISAGCMPAALLVWRMTKEAVPAILCDVSEFDAPNSVKFALECLSSSTRKQLHYATPLMWRGLFFEMRQTASKEFVSKCAEALAYFIHRPEM